MSSEGSTVKLRMGQLTLNLVRENEIQANHFNLIANMSVLSLLFCILIVYQIIASQQDYALTQRICFSGIISNFISIIFYFLLKPDNRILKYMLMLCWALFSTATAGLSGANETFVLLFPIIISVRYFRPRLTICCMGLMLVMLFVSKYINVKWGYVDVGLMVLSSNLKVSLSQQADFLQLRQFWDSWKTFMQIIIWQVPSAFATLLTAGMFLAYVAKIGLSLMTEKARKTLDERLAQVEEFKSDIAAKLLNAGNNVSENFGYVADRLCAFSGAAWVTIQQIDKPENCLFSSGDVKPNLEACKNCLLAAERATELFDEDHFFSYVSAKDDGPSRIPAECPANALISRMLYASGKPWGFLALHFCDARKGFSQDDRYIVNITAELLMSALDSARLNRRLQAERDNAIAAEKSKSLFFATVSHDIRTPLNAILGFAELLQGGDVDEATRKTYLDNIAFSGNTLLQLINDVLDLSKLEAGGMEVKKEFCSFTKLGDNMISAFSNLAAKKDLKLEARFAQGIPMVEIAFQRMRQILFNLLGNAIKFTEKGSVTLEASFNKGDAESGTLIFSVIDTGRGIAPENIEKIMNPFAQTCVEDQYQGTGLGLAIVKSMLKQLGGHIEVQSELGKGSAFTVTLENVRYAEEASPSDGKDGEGVVSGEAIDFSELSLLVVDDSKVNIAVIKAMFKQLGVTKILTAYDGKEAYECLKTNTVDMVFTDWWMPEMNGVEFASKVRQQLHLDLPIVLVTADMDAPEHCAGMGITSVLLKPVTVAKLREQLEVLLRNAMFQ